MKSGHFSYQPAKTYGTVQKCEEHKHIRYGPSTPRARSARWESHPTLGIDRRYEGREVELGL